MAGLKNRIPLFPVHNKCPHWDRYPQAENTRMQMAYLTMLGKNQLNQAEEGLEK